MSTLRIERVTALPGVVTASTLYIVRSAEAGLAEIFITSSDGLDTRHIINKAEINQLITDAIAGFNTVIIAATIAARDALTLTTNQLVLVTDASADATVTVGAAMYVWDAASPGYTKVTEYESLDLVLNWANLQDKPTSLVAEIDDAVTKRHAHANLAVLDGVGEDGNSELTYGGVNPQAGLAVTDW